MTGVGFTVLKAFLKKYPEFGMKLFAVGSLILGYYIAVTLHQRDIEIEFVIVSALIVSLCFYILYIITAAFKLLKKYEKNLNSGFNLSVVMTFLITLISFYLESEGWWTFCIGLCNTSDFDFFILLAQPFFRSSISYFVQFNLGRRWTEETIPFRCHTFNPLLYTCVLLLRFCNESSFACLQYVIISMATRREANVLGVNAKGTLQYDPLKTHAFVCYICMCVMEDPL